MVVHNTDWEVLTPTGWSSFDGVKKNVVPAHVILTFVDTTQLVCSPTHKIKSVSNMFMDAMDCKLGDVLYGNKIIDSVKFIQQPLDVFDVTGVDGEEYYTDNIVSHNCAFIRNAEEIWTSAQATLATGGKGILISTPNGIGNFFYTKYIEAEEFKGRKKEGVFFPIKLDWHSHPERDQSWRDQQNVILGAQKARQEYDAEFLGSGNTVVDSEVIEFYRQTFCRDPELKRGAGGDMWVWEQPDYGKSYIVAADVARGEESDTGDYSAFHVINAETCEQVAEYRGRMPTEEFGHMLYAVATEYNDALLIVENASVGWAVIQVIINRQYKNLFYMNEDLKYLDASSIYNNRLGHMDRTAIAGFTTSTRTRPLIISKLEQYMRERSIIIRSRRTIDELLTFIWENGKAQAADKYNDDLIMALAIGLWVRDTALQVNQNSMNQTKYTLDKLNRVSAYDGIYISDRVGPDPYKIQIGNNENHDLRWLL